MASMAYAVKAEPAENEALKGEGVKRSRKLYWPVDCSWREKELYKGALLELSAIKYSRRQSRRQGRRCQSFRVYLHFYCRSVVKNLIKYHVIDPFSVMPAPGPSWSAARVQGQGQHKEEGEGVGATVVSCCCWLSRRDWPGTGVGAGARAG